VFPHLGYDSQSGVGHLATTCPISLRPVATSQGRPASHAPIWSQQEPPAPLARVRVLHDPPDTDSYSLALVNDQGILPATDTELRSRWRQ
jgi:hypothetical protein